MRCDAEILAVTVCVVPVLCGTKAADAAKAQARLKDRVSRFSDLISSAAAHNMRSDSQELHMPFLAVGANDDDGIESDGDYEDDADDAVDDDVGSDSDWPGGEDD